MKNILYKVNYNKILKKNYVVEKYRIEQKSLHNLLNYCCLSPGYTIVSQSGVHDPVDKRS